MAQDDFETDVDIDAGSDIGSADALDQAPPKKSGGFLFKATVLLIAVAVGGFVAARHLGIQLPFSIPGLSAPQTAAAPATAQELAAQTAPAAETTIPSEAADAALADLSSPAGVPDMSAEQDSMAAAMPPQPMTAPPEDDLLAALDPQTEPVSNEADMAAFENELLPATDAPAAEATPETIDAFPADLTAPENTASITDGDAAPAEGIQDILSMPAPAQETATPVQELMQVAEQPPELPVNPVAETAAATPEPLPTPEPVIDHAAAGKMQELEQRIADMEQTLSGLKSNLASKDDLASIKSSLDSLESALATRALAPPPSRILKPKQETSIRTDVQKTAKSTAPKTAASRAAWSPRVAGQSWVLKSAKPGTAWIAERGSNEMKTVVIGDNVSGIGRVTSISQDSSGRWVVNGTQGKINQ
jgi:hypothetical protein